MPFYNDRLVVAAFNSCIDLTKYNALPPEVKTRFKDLMRAHRVKMVCFAPTFGFGLKVYQEEHAILDYSDDEVELKAHTMTDRFQVDLEGAWMRCPPAAWADAVTKPLEEKLWLVANESCSRFVGPDHDADWETADDQSMFLPAECDWKVGRSSGKLFTKTEAEEFAKRVRGGVVVRRRPV